MVQKFFGKFVPQTGSRLIRICGGIAAVTNSCKVKIRSRKIAFLATVFLLILVVGFGFFVHPAQAQGSLSFWDKNPILELLSAIMLALTRLALSLMLFVITFIVQVASYNGYLSSNAVNVGWVMVRDLTNMVFVVALLIIAFGTILGIEHYEWKHMLFKLVAAAVLVNFSRVICGVIIDIGQVVMMTFVNGIAATVGGNFIRAFSLDGIRSFSAAGKTLQIDSEGVYLAATASLFISVTVLVTSGIMLGMLVARVIVLWVLIVLSPIAFVLGVLDQTKSYASEWWSQFGKNVITGPVLVFFLWLTLVTVGDGLVNQQFANGPSGQPDTTAFSQSSGIGQALQWDKLVNFVIAIGMLLVGIKVTQQLGGIGAEWTGKAVDAGKKVAGFVSGYAAVRATGAKGYELAGKGYELAKTKAARPFVRVGERIGAKATQLYSEKYVEPRIAAADKRQKLLAKTPEGEYKVKEEEGGTRWERLKARAGLLMAPGVVKEKVLGAEKAAAEARIESWQHLASASSTPAGQRKVKAEQELEFLEHTGEKIKAEKKVDVETRMEHAMDILGREDLTEEQKTAELSKLGYSGERFKTYATRREKARKAEAPTEQKRELLKIEEELAAVRLKERLAGTEAYKAREEKITGFSAEVSQIQDRLASKKQLSLLSSIKELLAEQRAAGGGRAAEILAAKQTEMEQTNENNIAIANAKDNYLISQNRSGEATNVQLEMDKQAKIRQEAQAVGDYTLAMARFNQQKKLVDDMVDKKKKGDKTITDNAIDRAKMTLSDMYTANAAKHVAFANGARNIILPEGAQNPRSVAMELSNIRANQADELSIMLGGEMVEATQEGLKKGMERLLDQYKKRYGDDQADTRLQADIENRRQKMEVAAGQGAIGLAGLWKVAVSDDGKLRTGLTDINNDKAVLSKEAAVHIKSRRDAAKATAKLTSMTGGLGGSVDRNEKGKTVVNSNEAVEFIVNAAAPVKTVHLDKVDEYVKQDLGSIIKYSSWDKLEALLDGLNKKMDKNSRNGLLQLALDKVKIESDDDADAVNANIDLVKDVLVGKFK